MSKTEKKEQTINPTPIGKNISGEEPSRREVVVSMTSFPGAIDFATHAIRSLLKGSVVPDRLVLYLTLADFRDKKIPARLSRLEADNPVFEIRNYDHDIRSYRKLIPALRDFPKAVIVTVDDDVWYHRHMLRDLLRLHAREPHAVLAHRAKRIKINKPYRKWRKYRWYDFILKRIHRSFSNLQTGVGGVLYPPGCLEESMLDETLFTKLAPSCDDIWFWAAAALKGYSVIPVPFGRNKPHGLHKPKHLSLKAVNFKNGADRNAQTLKAIFEMFPQLEERLVNKQ